MARRLEHNFPPIACPDCVFFAQFAHSCDKPTTSLRGYNYCISHCYSANSLHDLSRIVTPSGTRLQKIWTQKYNVTVKIISVSKFTELRFDKRISRMCMNRGLQATTCVLQTVVLFG